MKGISTNEKTRRNRKHYKATTGEKEEERNKKWKG